MIQRPAIPDDAPALSRLATDSFVAAFGHLYGKEDLQAFLDEYRSVERYRADIVSPVKRVQLAEVDGRLAAYCLIVFGHHFEERPEPRPARPVFISQLYCLPEMTGHGLGAALMDWAIAEASAVEQGRRLPGAQSRWNRGKDLSWEPLRPELVCEVAFDHLQRDRFRHATTFRRWRPDRSPADCRYDQLEETPPALLADLFGG